jgi:AbrB family looped-hinge helix DNA binding protein
MENNSVIGIIRHIDDLGRIVIPKEIRAVIGVKEGDSLDILATTDGAVILRRVVNNAPTCPCPCATDNNRIYTIQSDYDDYLKVIKVTPEQDKLLDFLADEGILSNDFEIIKGYPDVKDFTK